MRVDDARGTNASHHSPIIPIDPIQDNVIYHTIMSEHSAAPIFKL